MGYGDPAGYKGDIAVVGMGCRFPGAPNVNEYWRLLCDPQPQFGAIPDSRWRHGSFRNADTRDPYAAYTGAMAIMPDVDMFDAAHYGIPPQRARSMDPQHRLLVDLAREAIQDAGWEASGFDTAETSVSWGCPRAATVRSARSISGCGKSRPASSAPRRRLPGGQKRDPRSAGFTARPCPDCC